MPNPNRMLAACCGLLLASSFGCRPPEVNPDQAPPGASVVVSAPGLAVGAKPDEIKVTVGGRPAAVARVEAGTGIEFVVPELEPGVTEVAVEWRGRSLGRASFRVTASPARQLVLSMTGQAITLVSERGATGLGRPSREAGSRRDLAYDVVGPDGRLIATGTVPHPLRGRRELFEQDGSMRGAPEPASGTFRLRIPTPPAGSVVRFFEFEPGTDLRTAEGRAARRAISEVRVGGGR